VAGKDNLKPFTKGDKRINRKGRPVTFDALRTLAQEISHETIPGKDGNPYTVAEAILRKWATSPNPALQMKFVEVAFGKVPEEMKLSGDVSGEVVIRIIYGNDGSNDERTNS